MLRRQARQNLKCAPTRKSHEHRWLNGFRHNDIVEELVLKRTAKWAISKTPWRIVRAEQLADHHNDGAAVRHNLMEGWDSKFADPEVLSRYYSPARHRLNAEILTTISRARPVADDDIIGDVGCGIGHFFLLAAGTFENARLFGYDFSKTGLNAARLRCPTAIFEHHDIYDRLPRLHHVSLCSQTLEHLLDPQRAATNLIEGTHNGGIVVLTVPDGRLDTYRGHIYFWSPESWEVWVKSLAAGRQYSCHRMSGGTAGGANLLAVIHC